MQVIFIVYLIVCLIYCQRALLNSQCKPPPPPPQKTQVLDANSLAITSTFFYLPTHQPNYKNNNPYLQYLT